jgi:hypothetical protein
MLEEDTKKVLQKLGQEEYRVQKTHLCGRSRVSLEVLVGRSITK